MSRIIDKETAPGYTWGDNCNAINLVNTETLSVKQESMPPHTKEVLHFHKHAQQFFYILKGTATFYCNGEKEMAHAQQGILIAPEEQHFIANETAEQLEFLVISQPATDKDRVNITPTH
ncbi:MAG: cupin domain-containing protein [Bacteroidota bacterium]